MKFMKYLSRPNESSTNERFVPAISHDCKRRVHVSNSNAADKLAGEYSAIAVAEASSVLAALCFILPLTKCLLLLIAALKCRQCGLNTVWRSDGLSNNVTILS